MSQYKALLEEIKEAEQRGRQKQKVKKVIAEISRKMAMPEPEDYGAAVKSMCPGLFGIENKGECQRLTQSERRTEIEEFMRTEGKSITLDDSPPQVQMLDIEKAKSYDPTLIPQVQLSKITESIAQLEGKSLRPAQIFQQIFQRYTKKGGTYLKSLGEMKEKLIYDLLFVCQHQNNKLKYKQKQAQRF